MKKHLIRNRFLVIVVEVGGEHKFAVLNVETNEILESFCLRSDAIEACITHEQENKPQN